MDSKEESKADEDLRNKAADNSDTVAQNKKRTRRVSFATEITSVRFFDRDEEYNATPSAETAQNVDDSRAELGSDGLLERNKEFGGDDIDGEEMEMQMLFLKLNRSPSSGGSTIDEDFFGPVSANFIKPGRLSDSAASVDHHEVTMDSTAFSMHYCSLAKSESGIDLKTPTGGQLFFEEKTPTRSNEGSSMIFTLGKKPIPKSSSPVTEVSANHSSNDMSLVGENPKKYDYDKLSPGLDALLAESRKSLRHVSQSDAITSLSPKRSTRQVSSSVDLDNDIIDLSDSIGKGSGWIDSNIVLNGDQSDALIEFGDANGSHGNFVVGAPPKRFSSSTLAAATSNEESHKPNSSPNLLISNESYSSLMASKSSPVKQHHILLSTASPSKPWGVTSPLPEKLGSLLKNGSIEHRETESSIQRSISKLELLEKSAFPSAFSAKVDNSTIKSLDFLKSPSVMEKNLGISRINFMEDSVNEEKLASVHWSTERNFAFGMDHARGENHLEKSLSQTMDGKLPNELSVKSISAGKSKSGPTTASPFKMTWSGNNNLFTSKLNDEDSLMTETESLLGEIVCGEGGNAICHNFVSSPDRILDNNMPASPGFQSCQSIDSWSQFEQIADYDKGRDSTLQRKFAHVNFSSATDNMGVVPKGMNGELSSQFVEVNRLNLIELRATDNREADIHNEKEIIQTTGNFSTPAKENEFQVTHLGVGDLTVYHESVSPSADRNLDQPKLHKFPAGSPSRKELDEEQLSRIPSPKTMQMSGGLAKFSANKRNLELLQRDPRHRTEISKIERSPKLQKSGNYDPMKIGYSIDSRTKLTGQEKQKLADAYLKFIEDMKILMFESSDKLSNNMIDVLEDRLVHQQRLKVYEMLQHEIVPQSTIVQHDLQLEKIAETKSLLHRVIFEKAKLQLKRVKRERVLKRLDLLSSRMLESQTLRTNIASLPLEICTSTVGGVGQRSLYVNLTKEHEVCHDKLNTMRQASEALDRKILNLMRTLHSCCKLKAEPDIGETIALVNEHLIKKTSYRNFRLDMQMWMVQGIASANDQHNVILNYRDFIIWSIKIIVGPTSIVRSSFKINEANITKNFPNIDAGVAFGFVFNAETACKYVGAKTLVQETQVTGSLLGSLLDVVEEVHIAQIEFQNLTQSSFSSPSVERLDLMLCFFNFDSGKKVSLTFDLSCLKRGIYPSEILPIQLASTVDSRTHSSSGIILDKIRDAVKDVRTGYMRILRLCQCVSQVV
ncbi:hypothetical protein C2S53_011714 [Perilla frutescens var. hirtella]|uniref:Uncharacterized protein n=1 Tax=Perilla frutescens var. hirtella TaxID=608512 RepID=A0AAD4IZ19_PERFH|nr:hypothetical protein C2S53_011714 [Perilla frutescens var. hirtella]